MITAEGQNKKPCSIIPRQDYLINLKQVSVSNTAESNLRMKEINEAIHQLPEIFKMPFLFYFDGYKYQEIAE